MSTYEDYDVTAKYYDSYRAPGGAIFVSGILSAYLGKPLSEMHLLDAGCGTGNFSKGLLDLNLGKVSLLDGSQGMLEVATRKMSSYAKEGKVACIVKDKLPTLPFNSDQFDAIILMQVLHHLDMPHSQHPNIKQFIQSAFRVLKPGGVLVINYCTAEQFHNFTWYASLLPRTCRNLAERIIPKEKLFYNLSMAGFGEFAEFVDFHNRLIDEVSDEPKNGFRDPEWRKLDSIWKLAEEIGEFDEATKKYDDMAQNGDIVAFINAQREKLKVASKTTTIFARKMK